MAIDELYISVVKSPTPPMIPLQLRCSGEVECTVRTDTRVENARHNEGIRCDFH